MNKTPTTLIIMDGFGLAPAADDNAVTLANTPVLDKLFKEYAHTTLSASGLDVVLPAGQMGNSEVGHTNIGGGRVVFQDLPRISRAIEDGSFFKNEAYNKAMDDCLKNDSSLHLYGLLSDGGVHSHIEHLFALLQMAKDKGLTKVYVHCFLDGRDVSPTSGKDFVKALQDKCAQLGVGRIATVMGRYYAMDRDKRWERVQMAYDAMVYGEGHRNSDPVAAVEVNTLGLVHVLECARRTGVQHVVQASTNAMYENETEFPTAEEQAAERERLFNILRELVVWENSNNKRVLDAAKAEIRKSMGDGELSLLDPFAGGCYSSRGTALRA